MKRVNVIGAGFSGAIIARELADLGYQVLLIEKREHIAGNAYDEMDANGVLIHKYGPHIFHTNSEKVFRYLSEFTEWRPYEHRVRASINGELYCIPINRTTINKLYSLNLSEDEVADYIETVREIRNPVVTSEDVVLNSVGRDLYEKFFKYYTTKQWGMAPSELKATVTSRIPVRTNDDDRYFSDEFQSMPKDGFTAMFRNILDHPNINLELGVDYLISREKYRAAFTVYTGPVDAYYNYCYEKLPYRSLRFEHSHIRDSDRYQPVAVVNYTMEYDYTRITEFKHLTGQVAKGTSIVREFPMSHGDPYYPIPTSRNERLYRRYRELVNRETDVIFLGRLAQYKYYNMDQCAAAALKTAAQFK